MRDQILYWLAEEAKTKKTMVIIPITAAETIFEAKKIANRHFKVKASDLHCYAGVKKGDKVESITSLSERSNCWMVWRDKRWMES